MFSNKAMFSVAMTFVAAGGAVAQTAAPTAEQTAQSLDTLPSAIESVLLKNPRIIAERDRRDIAKETLTQSHSALRPQISLTSSGGFSRSGSTRGSSFAGSTQEIDYYDSKSKLASIGIEATQTIYSGGTLQSGVRQAQYGVDSANAELMAVVQGLILETSTAYIDVRTAEGELSIRKQNVDALKKQFKAAKDRFEVGEVTRTDVAQAEARLSGSQADVASAYSALESAKAVYYELVGRPPVALAPQDDVVIAAAELEEAIEITLAHNPTIVSARAVLEVARQNVKIVKGQRRPTIDLVGTAGYRQEWSDGRLDDDNVELVARARLPLYQGGLLASRVRTAKLEENRALMQLRATERSLIAGVSRAWYTVIAADQAIEASQRQVEAAQIAFDGAEQELAAGLRTTLDVLDQERELLNARLGLINAERAAYLARQQLNAAMGELTPEKFGVNITLSSTYDYSGRIHNGG